MQIVQEGDDKQLLYIINSNETEIESIKPRYLGLPNSTISQFCIKVRCFSAFIAPFQDLRNSRIAVTISKHRTARPQSPLAVMLHS